jgi:hypothetical protein
MMAMSEMSELDEKVKALRLAKGYVVKPWECLPEWVNEEGPPPGWMSKDRQKDYLLAQKLRRELIAELKASGALEADDEH